MHLDPRLSKILSDSRIEQAQAIRQRRQHNPAGRRIGFRQKLGRWLVGRGERLIDNKPKAA